ncbi:hypothetical protein [Candidatus Coxiella mudrowiae]|nr:hypothetical protein [Candidatus Coxiella mudrowiae]
MYFAWRIVKYVKSNAIVCAKIEPLWESAAAKLVEYSLLKLL